MAARRDLAEHQLARLAEANPNPRCELYFRTPFQLLVSVVLSAQTTDKSVNRCMEPLYDAGFTYVNLDDGIVEVNRDANGNLVPDTKAFPNGWKELSDWIHSQGMLFGVYTDRGTQTCG